MGPTSQLLLMSIADMADSLGISATEAMHNYRIETLMAHVAAVEKVSRRMAAAEPTAEEQVKAFTDEVMRDDDP